MLSLDGLAAREMKVYSGPPMTLGNAVSAHVHPIVWCRDCGHRVEPDPAEQAQRFGAGTPVLRLVKPDRLFPLWEPRYRQGRDRNRAAIEGTPQGPVPSPREFASSLRGSWGSNRSPNNINTVCGLPQRR
jgi:hypothetical protein